MIEERSALRRIKAALVITTVFTMVEFFGGWFAGSLSIMTDAAHMFCDSSGFLLSWIAIRMASRVPTDTFTLGFQQVEALGALSSMTLVWFTIGFILIEGFERLQSVPEIDSKAMLVMSVLALLLNLILLQTLGHEHHGHGHSHGGDTTAPRTHCSRLVPDLTILPKQSRISHKTAYAMRGRQALSGEIGLRTLRSSCSVETVGFLTDCDAPSNLPALSSVESMDKYGHHTDSVNRRPSRDGIHARNSCNGHHKEHGQALASGCRDHEHGHDHRHDHDHRHCHNHGNEHDHKHGHAHEHRNENKNSHDAFHSHCHGVGGSHSHVCHGHRNLALSAAVVHVIGDILQSIGVILAALAIWTQPFDLGTVKTLEGIEVSRWNYMDPICSLFFGILVMWSTWHTTKKSIQMLILRAPEDLKIPRIRQALRILNNVSDVRDVACFVIGSKHLVIIATLVVNNGSVSQRVVEEATDLLRSLGATKTTIQVVESSFYENLEDDGETSEPDNHKTGFLKDNFSDEHPNPFMVDVDLESL